LLEAVARIDKGLGRLDTAEDLAKRSLAVRQKMLPSGDAAIGRSLATLGAVHMSKGQLDQAEKAIAGGLAILESSEGPDTLATARARSDYAQVLFWKGQSVKAEAIERQAYETYRKVLGPENAQAAMHLRNLGVLLDEIDRVDEAEKAYRDSQAILIRQLGPDHVNLAYSYLNLASLLSLRRGNAIEAEELYKKTLAIRKKQLGPTHPTVGQALQLTGLFYLNQGRLDESLNRWMGVTLIYEKGWWDNSIKCRVDAKFHLLESVVIYDGFAVESSHADQVLRDILEPYMSRTDLEPHMDLGTTLERMVHRIRPELDVFLLTDRDVGRLAGTDEAAGYCAVSLSCAAGAEHQRCNQH